MKNIILYVVAGVVALVVVIGAGAATAWYVAGLRDHGTATAAAAAAPADLAGSQVIELKEFVTNLADTPNPRYIKVTMQLVTTEKEKAKIEANVPRIRNAVIQLLNSKKSLEVTGNEGANKLQSDVKDVVNKALGGNPVAEVLITDIVVQF